jgi:hypothetical protein
LLKAQLLYALLQKVINSNLFYFVSPVNQWKRDSLFSVYYSYVEENYFSFFLESNSEFNAFDWN